MMDLYKAGSYTLTCCECGELILPGQTLTGRHHGNNPLTGEEQLLPLCLDCGKKEHDCGDTSTPLP